MHSAETTIPLWCTLGSYASASASPYATAMLPLKQYENITHPLFCKKPQSFIRFGCFGPALQISNHTSNCLDLLRRLTSIILQLLSTRELCSPFQTAQCQQCAISLHNLLTISQNIYTSGKQAFIAPVHNTVPTTKFSFSLSFFSQPSSFFITLFKSWDYFTAYLSNQGVYILPFPQMSALIAFFLYICLNKLV